MSEEAQQRNLRNVMVFAIADGKLSADEKELIESLRQRMGISDEEFSELCADVRREPGKYHLPRGHDEALAAISLLLDMAAVDDIIAEGEMRLLQHLADSAGLASGELDELIRADHQKRQAIEAEIGEMIEEIYRTFESWDAAARRGKFEAIGAIGPAAAVPLLRMFESYRRPDGLPDVVELKVFVAGQLGRLADRRAAYYLAQQINLGDMEDDVTCLALRSAAVEALGQCVGASFPSGQDGIDQARSWWNNQGRRQTNQLAF